MKRIKEWIEFCTVGALVPENEAEKLYSFPQSDSIPVRKDGDGTKLTASRNDRETHHQSRLRSNCKFPPLYFLKFKKKLESSQETLC